MLRRNWKPLVAAAVVGSSSAYLYHHLAVPSRPTFPLSIRTRDKDGKASMTTRAIPLLTLEEVNERLTEHATAHTIARPNGIVWRHTTAHVASNSPLEDANAHSIVARDPEASGAASAGDLLFFAVMDGHGGYNTSQLLSRTLIPTVALELSALIAEPRKIEPKLSLLQRVKANLTGNRPESRPFASDPKYVGLAIQTAFAKLDSEIINAPIRLVAQALDELGTKHEDPIPDLSAHPMALATMLPALSGSCALLAMFDTQYKELYVACTGDSRAVAGVWDQGPDGKGTWRVDVLSEDQTGRNPSELTRMQEEHPPDESSFVIQRGRVLGGLEPTRAFGDARYKWPVNIQALLNHTLLAGNEHPMRGPPVNLKTPPYVTSQPVITHRKIDALPGGNVPNVNAQAKPTLRFIVLATDGLWDEISSEDVVALVAGHLAGLKGTVPKSQLPSLVPVASTGIVEGTDKGRDRRKESAEGSWAFVDDNVSAHLIRNAFGGGDEASLQRVVSIPPPLARRYRDDVTVTVVWWEDGNPGLPVSTQTSQAAGR